jgi:hypothetical protein
MTKHEKVESSSIRSVGYDPATSTLELAFHGSGKTHAYHNVPWQVHAKLMMAKSKGQFAHRNIFTNYRTTEVLSD